MSCQASHSEAWEPQPGEVVSAWCKFAERMHTAGSAVIDPAAPDYAKGTQHWAFMHRGILELLVHSTGSHLAIVSRPEDLVTSAMPNTAGGHSN